MAVRPIVIVFPVGTDLGSDIEIKKEASDGLTGEQRTVAAARGVRDCLNDSGAVSAILYNPDGAMFVRTESEANIHLAHPRLPSEAEREALGKAFGAIYVVAVSARPAVDSPAVLELVIQGNDVVSKASFSDKTVMSASAPGAGTKLDNDAIHKVSGNREFDNIVMSAANTVTVHLLKGPLGDYYKSAVPPELLPKQAMATPVNIVSATVAPPTAEIHTSATANPAPLANVPAVVAPSVGPAPAVSTARSVAPVQPAEAPKPADDGIKITDAHFSHSVIDPKTTLVPLPGTIDKTAGGASQPAAGSVPDLHGIDALHQAIALGAKPNESSRAARQQAVELLSTGDASAAISILRRAIDQDPLSASLRIQLALAYSSVHRMGDAASEARRVIGLVPDISPADEASLAKVFAESFAETGDKSAARETYNQIVAMHSPHTAWARAAIADLDAADGKPADAEKEYLAILEANRNNREAAIGLARLRSDRGDYDGAVKALQLAGNDSSAESAVGRYEATTAFFDDAITKIATLMAQNRKAWEAGSLSQQIIFNATTAQTARVTGLVTILKAVPPPASNLTATKSFRMRVSAGALLAQASADLLAFLQAGDADAGAQSSLELVECQKEIEDAQRR